MNGNVLVYQGIWSFEEHLRIYIMWTQNHVHWSTKSRFEIVQMASWIIEPLRCKKLFIYGIFSLHVVYCYLYSLFDTESTFSYSKIGKFFEFLSEL